MDKSVKRISVIEGSGENRLAKVVYENPADIDVSAIPPIEQAVRHIVNATLITARVAYDTYVKRAAEGKTDWVFQPRSKGTQAETAAASSHAADDPYGDEP
jgi:hypothetical protein